MKTYMKVLFVLASVFLSSCIIGAQTPVWDDALGSPVSGSYHVSSSSGELRIPQEVPYSPDVDWSVVADNLDMGFRGSGQTWIRVLAIEETDVGRVSIVISYSENTLTSARNAYLGNESTYVEIYQTCGGSSPITPDLDDDDEDDDYPSPGANPESPTIPDIIPPSKGLSPDKTKNWIMLEHFSSDVGCQEIIYYNGLGFPQQSANIGSKGPCRYDVVSLFKYDIFGNQTHLYLPYSRNVSDGSYDYDGENSQISYYTDIYSDDGKFAYGEHVYETMIGGRLLKSVLPGGVMQDHLSETEYVANVMNDIEILDVDSQTGDVLFEGYYQPGTLYGVRTSDGDGRVSIVWKDYDGRVVCTESGVNSDKNRTLYGYDFRGNLCWVISPEGYSKLSESDKRLSVSASIASSYCWIYRYDGRGNLTARYSPGAGLELMLHDAAGRLVMRQDANMRQKRVWLGQTYDQAGRVLLERVIKDDSGTNWEAMLPELDPVVLEAMNSSENGIVLRQFIYDRQPADLSSAMRYEIPEGIHQSISNLDWRGHLSYEYVSTAVGEPYAERAYYYDVHGNSIQIIEKRLDGVLRTSYSYDLQKRVTGMQCEYTEPENGIHDVYINSFDYDRAGRLLSEETSLNGHIASVRYEYDGIGRLVGKSYSGDSFEVFSPYERFTYSIQGWEKERKLTIYEENDVYVSELHYYDATAGSKPSYTGNISSWDWRSCSAPERSYKFAYDLHNRMTDCHEYEDGIQKDEHAEYDIQYDHNGNLLSMTRVNGEEPEVMLFVYDGNKRSGTQFSYDANGNLTDDLISYVNAEYNILNLPSVIYGDGDYYTEYVWLADGTKIMSDMEETNSGYYYVGPFVYRHNGIGKELSSVAYGGGRIAKGNDGKYSTIIYFRDHIGSTRVKVKGENEVIGKYDYLPYGELTSNSTYAEYENDWLFGGKEMERRNDINWYDSGARWQTTHGVFTSMDPLAEKYYPFSPYTYCAGNPVNIVDPDGESWYYNSETGEFVSHIDDGNDYVYLITPDQIKSAGNDNSELQKYAVFENSFGQLLLENKVNNTIAVNVFTHLFSLANRKKENENEKFVEDSYKIVLEDNFNEYAKTSRDKKLLIINTTAGWYCGYDSILIMSHEIGHMLDNINGRFSSKNIERANAIERYADEFAMSHWSYQKATASGKSKIIYHYKAVGGNL